MYTSEDGNRSGDADRELRNKDGEKQPESLQQPRWLGKAKRHHILLKFIIICLVVALLFLGVVIFAVQP